MYSIYIYIYIFFLIDIFTLVYIISALILKIFFLEKETYIYLQIF